MERETFDRDDGHRVGDPPAERHRQDVHERQPADLEILGPLRGGDTVGQPSRHEEDRQLVGDGIGSAIEIARQQRIDVAVLDVRMGGMSGLEVLERLRFIDPNIEAIMMTAFETTDTMRQALRLRACDYINKPFDVVTIRAAVSKAMEQRSLGSEVQTNNEKLQQLQTELREMQMEEELARTRDLIYASIIHDINGPLTIISGLLQMINQRMSEETKLVPHEHVVAAWLGLRGAGGVVSHESALDLYELSDVIPNAVHLSLPRSKRGTRRRDGVRLHTTDHPADSSQIRQVGGVPVTSPERTIVDALDAGTQPEQIEMAVHQAIDRGISSPGRIRAATDDRSPRTKHFIARVLDERPS